MSSRSRRQRSTPPVVEHTAEDSVIFGNGFECQTRCALRQSIYEALQIDEDRSHTWALVERARQLPQLPTPASPGAQEPMKVDLCDGWTCVCGVRSPEKGLFCWKCGTSRSVVQPHDAPRRIDSSMVFNNVPLQKSMVQKLGAETKQPASRVDFHGQSQSQKGKKITSSGTISKQALESLGNVISKYAPTLEALTETVSNKGSNSEGSDDKEVSTCEGPSNSGSESTEGNQQEITTVMICSLPFRVTNNQLIDAINELGFKNQYDFVYMPSRSSKSRSSKAKAEKSMRRGNVGYAFVNFRSAEYASRFIDAFQDYQFADVPSEKEILVKPAVCQGYEANVSLHFNKLNPGSMMTFDLDGREKEPELIAD